MIDGYRGVMIYDAGDIPSKLVSKHTFPDGIESMFIENNFKKNDKTHTILKANQMAIFKSVGKSLDQYHQIYGQLFFAGGF